MRASSESTEPSAGMTVVPGYPAALTRAGRSRATTDRVWAPAYDGHGTIREGAWVAELTDLLDLSSVAPEGWVSGDRLPGAAAPPVVRPGGPIGDAAGDMVGHAAGIGLGFSSPALSAAGGGCTPASSR